MSEIVSARNLVKRYGALTAVDGISFSVQGGECFGFLGPNGAGKTTTIRMITCVSPPSSGERAAGGGGERVEGGGTPKREKGEGGGHAGGAGRTVCRPAGRRASPRRGAARPGAAAPGRPGGGAGGGGGGHRLRVRALGERVRPGGAEAGGDARRLPAGGTGGRGSAGDGGGVGGVSKRREVWYRTKRI